jgi:hypothetical protein
MKRLKTLSASILIGFASLLSSDVGAKAPSRNQEPIKQTQQNKASDNRQKQTATDERGTNKLPLSVKLLNTGKSQAETDQETQQEKNTANTNWWVIRLGFAGVGIALLQLAAFIVQAVRLKQTIDVMRDTPELPNRAHLNIEEFFAGPLSVTFNLRNAGHVPATEVWISWFRQDPSIDPEIIQASPQNKWRGEVYGPSEMASHQLYFFVPLFEGGTPFISQSDMEQLKSGALRFDVFVVVSYNDGFGKPRISWQKISYDTDKETWISIGARHD